jgi:hypothetical protein
MPRATFAADAACRVVGTRDVGPVGAGKIVGFDGVLGGE